MQIYLDNAATTPVDSEVISIITKVQKKNYGNPSSIHKKGEEAKELLENSRKIIAKSINANPEEIYFVSSGTQANNLAIRGILKSSKNKELIISSIEHASINNLVDELKKDDYIVHKISVDNNGYINFDEFKNKLSDKIALVSIMLVNNETGVIQEIEKIAKLCSQKNIPFHTDAVQAYKKLVIDVKKLNIDALTISAHKIHGPKGIAALYLKNNTPIKPIIYGGKQEKNLNPGTENIPAIVGFATAVKLPYHINKIEKVKLYFLNKLQEIPNITINTPSKSVINIINISIEGIDGETLVKHLSQQGIYVSTGSACSSTLVQPSHVLMAMGKTDKQARSSIRISLGKETTKKDIDQTIKHLKSTIYILRKI